MPEVSTMVKTSHPGDNQDISPSAMMWIRLIDDFDLTMVISEIHDHGWDHGRSLLKEIVTSQGAKEETNDIIILWHSLIKLARMVVIYEELLAGSEISFDTPELSRLRDDPVVKPALEGIRRKKTHRPPD